MRFLGQKCLKSRMNIAYKAFNAHQIRLLSAALIGRTAGYLLVCACCAAAPLAGAQTALPATVLSALEQAGIAPVSMSAIVIPVDDGAARLAVNTQRAMQPASTMKTVTTQVALDVFGPAQQWKTQFLSAAPMRGGTLAGALHVRGGGDFAFSAERLHKALRALRAQGIRAIAGNIVLDRSRFTPPRLDLGAPPFDEYPDAYYNLIPDALLLNHNMLEFMLIADARRIRVQTAQTIYRVRISAAKLKLVERDCGDWADDFQVPQVIADAAGLITVVLQGSFPRNCTISTETNVLDRNVFWERVLRAQLREIGIAWHGSVRDGVVPADAKPLHESSSEPLAAIIRAINKDSDNGMTRLLLLNLGAAQTAGSANTLEAGRAAVDAWFDRAGIARAALVVENGSGLSRTERVSAEQLAYLLRTAARGRWSAEFLASLPIAGVDGSMRERLAGTAAQQAARIKTGTLGNVIGVAGYVHAPGGQMQVVVGLVNHANAKRGRAALDALIEWVASPQAATP
jgi:D-alanyl-D-alanine carboxypeptidase/D-alanyl-D-alanine-endopeptidase (penicillin-binding protein 4)